MPTAVTVATFQAAIGSCHDAIASADYASARSYYAQAEAIHSGLEFQASDAGAFLSRRSNLDGLRKAIEFAETEANRRTSLSRFVRTRTSHAR